MPSNEFMLAKLDSAEWLKLNAKLQQKKRALRTDLCQRGVLEKGGYNAFDKYRYFSEAQYKLLFTELLSKHGLELTFNEEEYLSYQGTEKQAQGRIARLAYTLTDCDTGFSETGTVSGEGMDKGDKAGYKAYTGALKYYLSNTFLVATGDDAETASPSAPAPARAPKPAAKVPSQESPFAAAYKACKKAGISDEEMKGVLLLHIPGKSTKDYTPEESAQATAILRDMLTQVTA